MAEIFTAHKSVGMREMRRTLRKIVKLGQDNRELLDAFGQTLGESAVNRLAVTNEGPDGQAWAPSARSERTGGKIQYDSGMAGLAGSLTHRVIPDAVEVGSPLVYALQRQMGGTILPKRGEFLAFEITNDEGEEELVFARSVTQPARPYLGVSADDADELAGLALDYLDGIMAEGQAGQAASP